MTGGLYTSDANWDMRSTWLENISDAFQLSFEFRMKKDPEGWYIVLSGVYNRLPMLHEEEIFSELFKSINDGLYSKPEDRDAANIALSIIMDKLDLLERNLIKSMYDRGLVLPRKHDPMHAAAEGHG